MRASLEAAQHLYELRQLVAPLHREFSWQRKWEQLLSLDSRFREMDSGRDYPARGHAALDATALPGYGEVLLDPIPLWPADRWPASEEYVARRIRLHGNAGLRCLVYPSHTAMPLGQSATLRLSLMLDVINFRGPGSVAARPPHVLANRALMLFERWRRRAAQSPTVLPAARSIYAHLLDAPPVDGWNGYYSLMHGTIWRLRDFVREARSADQPTALLVPFTLEPYALALLADPDYPTNLLLANVFPESPLALDMTPRTAGASAPRPQQPAPPRQSLVRPRDGESATTSRLPHALGEALPF